MFPYYIHCVLVGRTCSVAHPRSMAAMDSHTLLTKCRHSEYGPLRDASLCRTSPLSVLYTSRARIFSHAATGSDSGGGRDVGGPFPPIFFFRGAFLRVNAFPTT